MNMDESQNGAGPKLNDEAADQILGAIEKTAGKGWFNQNKQGLREVILEAMVPVNQDGVKYVSPVDYALLSEECEAIRAQLVETVGAHETVGKEYQAAHKALIDVAKVLLGEEAVLKEAPLTIEKLYGIITQEISRLISSSDSAASRTFDVIAWAKARQKNLNMVGHGPLAMGRYEGEKDILVQLINAAKRRG